MLLPPYASEDFGLAVFLWRRVSATNYVRGETIG